MFTPVVKPGRQDLAKSQELRADGYVRMARAAKLKTSVKQIVEHRQAEFVISTDNERLDLDLVHGFLTQCYWAKEIPREVVARSIENSLCFGVYGDGKWALRV